jgi:cation diffusion facilitator CzcD-associated flavoprotein CzcO
MRKVYIPNWFAFNLTRLRNIFRQQYYYKLARDYPKFFTDFLLGEVKKNLPKDFDVEKHFTPYYKPWDQRICVIPNGDLFEAIKAGKMSVETGHIEKFVKDGIQMKDGNVVKADVIVTATGLRLLNFGGIRISVNGKAIEPCELITYRGAMFEGLPNFFSIFGYLNASWTIRAELLAHYIVDMVNMMDDKHLNTVTPVVPKDSTAKVDNLFSFTSGYFQRSMKQLPKQLDQQPWRLNQNYFHDVFGFSKIEDPNLQFS